MPTHSVHCGACAPCVAQELALGDGAFESSLPVMVKALAPAQEEVRRKLLASRHFARWLQAVAPAEESWFRRARESWRRWKSRHDPARIRRGRDALIARQASYRRSRGLNVSAPVRCPLDEESRQLLPPLDWRGSGFGLREANPSRPFKFRYCI